MSSIQTFHFRLLYTKTDTRPNLIFKMNISAFFSILHCFFILALSGHTMWKLMWFLSSAQVLISNVSNQSESLLFPLWFDTGLVVLFVFQHSYLKTSQIGNYLARYRITKSVARSIYVVLTSVALQVFLLFFFFRTYVSILFLNNETWNFQIIMFFWMPIPSYCLWKLDSDSSIVWWTISVSHLIAWACIYGGSVILDLPELVGIKQVRIFLVVSLLQKCTIDLFNCRSTIFAWIYLRHQILNQLNFKDSTHTNVIPVSWPFLLCFGWLLSWGRITEV